MTLAEDTGGKAFLDSNDLAGEIQQARDDVHSYYILGFYSTNAKEDGKFRRIQVKLNKPGLQAKLDYRDGYYANKTFKKFNESDKESQLQEALLLGDPMTDLPISFEADYFRLGPADLLRADFGAPARFGDPARQEGLETRDADRFHRPGLQQQERHRARSCATIFRSKWMIRRRRRSPSGPFNMTPDSRCLRARTRSRSWRARIPAARWAPTKASS